MYISRNHIMSMSNFVYTHAAFMAKNMHFGRLSVEDRTTKDFFYFIKSNNILKKKYFNHLFLISLTT